MAEDTFGWLFVDYVPLLYEKRRVARQFQVETWLDLEQTIRELGIKTPAADETKPQNGQMAYVV